MKTTSDGARHRWWLGGILALGVLLGVPMGMLFDSGDDFQVRLGAPGLAFAAPLQIGNTDGDSVTFIPFRRNLWAIDHENSTIQFFMFPSTEEKPVIPSRPFPIDRGEFPADSVRYQVSDRHLTNFLWVINPLTGNVRYLKALRDGKIDSSKLYNVSQE